MFTNGHKWFIEVWTDKRENVTAWTVFMCETAMFALKKKKKDWEMRSWNFPNVDSDFKISPNRSLKIISKSSGATMNQTLRENPEYKEYLKCQTGWEPLWANRKLVNPCQIWHIIILTDIHITSEMCWLSNKSWSAA